MQKDLKINDQFRMLIPPLSKDEFNLLKENIICDGIREPICVWNDEIIDGMNRYKIAQELGLPYKTVEMEFENETAAKEWIMKNQLGRRNLPDVVRGRIALQLKDSLAARARERQVMAGGDRKSEKAKSLCPILDKADSLDTKKEIAKMAGLSHGTIAKIDTVDRTAPEPIKQAMGNIISIDKAYKLNKALQGTPEHQREDKAQSLVMQAYERESEELRRRNRISDKLENMIFNITTNGNLVTEEYVGYMLENTIMASEWIEKIDRAKELLDTMKEYLKKYNQIRRVK